MSVRRRKRRAGTPGTATFVWMIDIKYEHPDGRIERVRKVSPVQSRRGAEQYERDVRQALLEGRYGRKEAQAPTLKEFEMDFIDLYARTENKQSEVEAKQRHLKNHIVPFFGHMRLDAIGAEHVTRYKAAKLKDEYDPKSVNNQLAVLRRLLAVAVEWGRLKHVPALKWLLRAPPPTFDFLTFEEAERVVAGSSPEWRAMIVVALKTGLRHGELLALRWEDIDLVAGRLMVRRSLSGKRIDTPKNHKSREVALSDEAIRALKAHRHLRGELVFCDEKGQLLTRYACKWPLWQACKRAGTRDEENAFVTLELFAYSSPSANRLSVGTVSDVRSSRLVPRLLAQIARYPPRSPPRRIVLVNKRSIWEPLLQQFGITFVELAPRNRAGIVKAFRGRAAGRPTEVPLILLNGAQGMKFPQGADSRAIFGP